MWKRKKSPYRLLLNTAASKEIEWHCKHYKGRGLMKFFNNGNELAQHMGIDQGKLEKILDQYNQGAKSGNDQFGKKFFPNLPLKMTDNYHVAIVTPVVHYTMGGIYVNEESEVLKDSGVAIPGLWASGEVMGGVHGVNRLGGNSLLDCVVFGRIAGSNACKYLLEKLVKNGGSSSGPVTITMNPGESRIDVEITVGGATKPRTNTASQPAPAISSNEDGTQQTADKKTSSSADKIITREEVAKHTADNDCWVIVNGQVLDCTHFMSEHPGGKQAIMLFAGKDASEEFNMLHEATVVEKYAPDTVIGRVAEKAKM
eukprot:GHVL01022052.1.p2 GENE.GHVL01022052.1~~GHVL01022052.1.p2  ORF type:complete len:314 (-),score=53.50 GHVL01022052.1:959-1900(-)